VNDLIANKMMVPGQSEGLLNNDLTVLKSKPVVNQSDLIAVKAKNI
jgi:hypothetical protein